MLRGIVSRFAGSEVKWLSTIEITLLASSMVYGH
jgi:hypothetical protein